MSPFNKASLILSAAVLAASASAQFSATNYGLPTGYRGDSVHVFDQNGGGMDITLGAYTSSISRVLRRSGPAFSSWASLDAYTGRIADHKIAKLDNSWPYDVVSCATNGTSHFIRVRRYPSGVQTIPLPANFVPQKIETADLDNDGDQDVSVVGWGNSRVYFARNTGAGTMTGATTLAALSVAPSRPQCFTHGDFNHDGKIDYIVPRADGNVSYFRNITVGAVNFASAQTYANPNTRPWDVCADDFNGDGWLDFATANSIGSCTVWLNQGPPSSGSWTSVNFVKTTYTIGTPNTLPRSICCMQYDCDGDVDLAVGLSGTNKVAMLVNNGSGSFVVTLPASATTGPNLSDIDCGDLDNDKDADIATANLGTTTGSATRLTRLGTMPLKRHIYVGGISDGLSTSTPAGTEHACPRPGAFSGYASPLRHFDQGTSCVRNTAHTFPNVAAGHQFPNYIVKARLSMRFRGDCTSSSNDTIRLGFQTGPNAMVVNIPINSLPGAASYGAGTWAGASLDLADLPGGLNLIPKLNSDKSLDIIVGNGTRVDSINLVLECCHKYRCGFSMKQTNWIAGTNFTIASGGAPAGGFTIYFMSPAVGPGVFLPGGQFCLITPVFLLGVQPTSAGGSANMTFPLPPVLPGPCFTLSTQALHWPSFCMSNTWTAQLFN